MPDRNQNRYDDFYRCDLAQPNSREALEWLQEPGRRTITGSEGSRGAMSREQLVALVNRLYEMGAVKVVATKIYGKPEHQDTDRLVIELPDDPESRKRLFSWVAKWDKKGIYDPTPDTGQRYLLLAWW